MFCQKCGAEMKDGSNFCEKCGAKVNSGNGINVSVGSVSLDSLKSKNMLMPLIDVALLVLSYIFSITKIFSLSVFGQSANGPICDNPSYGIIFFFLYALSAVIIVAPGIFRKAGKIGVLINERANMQFLPAILTTALSLFWVFIQFIRYTVESKKGLFSSADFSFSVTGWLYLIVAIASIVVAVVCIKARKKAK